MTHLGVAAQGQGRGILRLDPDLQEQVRSLPAEHVVQIARLPNAFSVSHEGESWPAMGPDSVLTRHGPCALRAISETTISQVISVRRQLRFGPYRLPRLPGSTVCKVLRRHGLSRLRDLYRVTAIPIRYVREQPGELLHVTLRSWAGFRLEVVMPMLDYETGRHNRRHEGEGYEFVNVAVDDCSRVAFARVMPSESGASLITMWSFSTFRSMPASSPSSSASAHAQRLRFAYRARPAHRRLPRRGRGNSYALREEFTRSDLDRLLNRLAARPEAA
jgi:hypothetical protein